MNTQSTSPKLQPLLQTERAFTLVEVIGVLAVIAILAAVLLPALIKETDKAVADQESVTLQAFNDALQRTILRTRTIPSETNWAAVVAGELGMATSDVLTNSRHWPRVFLIDTNGWFANVASTFSYVQPYLPPAGQPTGARLLVLSSLGSRGIPMTSGRPKASDFNALWNDAPGTLTPGVPVGSTWPDPADVVIQRINLSPLFMHLVLTWFSSDTNAYYSIDDQIRPTSFSANQSTWVDSYFLKDSVLGLYSGATNSGALDSKQIMTRDLSFVYYLDGWRDPLSGNITLTATNASSAFDFSAIVNAFLSSPGNTAAGAATQTNAVQAFIDYMSAYTNWMQDYNPNNPSQFCNDSNYQVALVAQTNLYNVLLKLYVNPPPPQYSSP